MSYSSWFLIIFTEILRSIYDGVRGMENFEVDGMKYTSINKERSLF
jgi:hypothetical protein